MNKKIFLAALSATLPVLLGYLSIGIAFGFMLSEIGYNALWAGFMSLFIYAGSMQFIAVDLIGSSASLFTVAITAIIIQSRHMLYGLSLIEKFKNMGKLKLYMIFSLTDETYALLTAAKPPKGTSPKCYYFLIAILDHSYWIAGSIIGATLGNILNIDTKGIDFAMTALFVVIATEQWLEYKTHRPAIIGMVCSILALIAFGASNLLIPAMIMIIAALFVLRKTIEQSLESSTDTEVGP